jgi:hypothetical protein
MSTDEQTICQGLYVLVRRRRQGPPTIPSPRHPPRQAARDRNGHGQIVPCDGGEALCGVPPPPGPALFYNRRSVDSEPRTCCQWLLDQCSYRPDGPKEAREDITEAFQPIRQGENPPSDIEIFSVAIVATSDRGITQHALLRCIVPCLVAQMSGLCLTWNSCTRADRGSRP